MRFWKWHALGNSYLVVDEHVEAELARRLCDVSYGIGSDGVVEVVSVNGGRAEIAIWNPDGSVAEFSGNGSRIAAAWLCARAGTTSVRIAVAGRDYPATLLDDGLIAMAVGDVEVGEIETISLDGERVELTAVSVGNPHAVVRLAAEREELLRLGPLIERHERFPERTNVQLVRVERRERVGRPRLGARGGRDERLRLERRRSSSSRRHERLVREPGHRPHARRRASGRARRRGADHTRRPGRGDLRRRASPLARRKRPRPQRTRRGQDPSRPQRPMTGSTISRAQEETALAQVSVTAMWGPGPDMVATVMSSWVTPPARTRAASRSGSAARRGTSCASR